MSSSSTSASPDLVDWLFEPSLTLIGVAPRRRLRGVWLPSLVDFRFREGASMSTGGDSVRSTMLDARVIGGCGDCG